MCEVKLIIHSQTTRVQPLKFGNGQVIASHILGLKLNHVTEMGPR